MTRGTERRPDLADLEAFIVEAKAATYAAAASRTDPSRSGSHDLRFERLPFAYLDSYFGGTDFAGQEVVYFEQHPVWVMNYYGRIVEPTLLDARRAGEIIQHSLSALYRQRRFLGGFDLDVADARYTDTNDGDVASFRGLEWITCSGRRAYELVYHGGLVFD